MPLLDLLWAMFWLFWFILWIWLVISVFIDIFRSDDLSGWGKAAWALFVLVLPLIGVLVYLLARGGKMQERRVNDLKAQNAATQEYIRATAGTSGASTADELEKLKALHDDGTLTDDEYQSQKAKLLA